ncbi:HrgC protein, partial [Helicobacter pylori]
MVVAALFTFGLSNIVFAFIYNKQYTTRLLESGYEPADEYSRGILQSRGMIA